MELDNSDNFNERLGQWVASQGFWFQLRHPIAGRSRIHHILGLGTKVAVFATVVALVSALAIWKIMDSPARERAVEQKLQAGMQAKELKTKKIFHTLGRMNITRLESQGGENTFYNNLEALGLSWERPILDRMTGKWNAGMVEVDQLDLDLRAGADNGASSAKIGEMVFKKSDEFGVKGVVCPHTSLRWGYSNKTRGFIQNSAMRAVRAPQGWVFTFRGGTFSQNWMNDLSIAELVVTCTPQGILLQRASFHRDGGTVDMKGVEILAGARPAVKGMARIQHLKLDAILPAAAADYVEGAISGNFKMGGSLNTPEGVTYDGRITLGGADYISLRDRVKLLDVLTLADGRNKYRRLNFTEGGFHLKTAAGGMEVGEVNVKAGDLLTMSGQMSVRQPTFEEINRSRVQDLQMEAAPEINSASGAKNSPESIKKTVVGAKKTPLLDDGLPAPSAPPEKEVTGLELTPAVRDATVKEASLALTRQRYAGLFRLTMRPDAFEKPSPLAEIIPRDSITQRYLLDVPLEGTLEELTERQARFLLEKLRR